MISNEYLGDGAYYIICDVCGRKIRRREAVMGTALTQKGLLLCQRDYDEDNQQSYVRGIRDRYNVRGYDFRGESTDVFEYIDSPDEIETGNVSNPAGRNPDAPTDLKAFPESASQIDLQWRITGSPGSTPICGYKIERESPVSGGFSVLVANTGYPSTYHQDKTVASGTQYNYRISAINANGTGDASNEANTTTP